MATQAPHLLALINLAFGITFLPKAYLRTTWAWVSFFGGGILVAVLDGSVVPFISLGALVLILFAESKWPRSQKVTTEALSRKFSYVFFKRATRPMITAVVAAIGLSVWSPAWGMKTLGWPLWIQTVVVLFVIDFEKYWIHRGQHKFDTWWRFHKVHHIYRDLRAISYGATHFGEFVFVQSFLITGLTTLIGADVKALLLGYILPSGLVAGLWAHANIDLPRKKMPWWSYIIMTPNVHGLHHSENSNRSNYSEIFPVWDFLFGTFRSPIVHHQDLERIGVAGELPTGNFWQEQLFGTSIKEYSLDDSPAGELELVR